MFRLEKLLMIPRQINTGITFLFTLLLLSSPVSAFEQPTEVGLSTITSIIGRLAGWLLGIAGAFFVIMFMIKGFKLATTAGNPRERVEAINGLLWTGVGAVVTFGAWFLVGVVMGIGNDPTQIGQ